MTVHKKYIKTTKVTTNSITKKTFSKPTPTYGKGPNFQLRSAELSHRRRRRAFRYTRTFQADNERQRGEKRGCGRSKTMKRAEIK